MGFLDLFKSRRRSRNDHYTRWDELGSYRSFYSAFGNDIYRSDLVRSCVRPLADHSAKANAICTDKSIQRILNVSPNVYMSGYDFLAKVRTRLELSNTVFILIGRDDKGHAISFYPIPYVAYEALEYNDELFIQFRISGAVEKTYVFPWADLAVLRKDYNNSDIAGDDNGAILDTLSIIHTVDEGISNAIRSTSNLRGIIKSTKAMLAPEAVKASKDQFVRDYMNLENEGGIAALDATMEFTPINMSPTVASWEQRNQLRDDICRYFGVSDDIINGKYTESDMEAFYESRIEPFLVALSVELTRKVFTERERAFGAEIVYESNRLQFASTTTKLQLVAMVDRGAMTPNEWRMVFNLAPIPGGDEPIRRLDTAVVGADAGGAADDGGSGEEDDDRDSSRDSDSE